MPKSFATLVNEVEQELQDSSNNFWTAAEIGIQLEDAVRELADYEPYVVMHTFKLEGRFGAASSTTSGALVDATKSQFVAGDVDKVIYNRTDRTWTTVTAFVSSTQLTLSKDIMASGEDYEMFDQDCWNHRQIYLGDVLDGVGPDEGVIRVEYPITGTFRPRYRNFSVERGVLTIGYDGAIPDTSLASAIDEVNVWIARRHQVSQLTDLAGALTAGASEGDTSIAVDGLSGTEVVAEDQELTVAGLRGVYRVTDSGGVTLSAGAGTLTIWPPLENDVENNDVVTFLGSSLNRDQEEWVVELCAGRCILSKGVLLIQQADAAITSVSSVTTALGLVAAKVLRQVTDVASGRTAAGLSAALLTSANTEIGLSNTEIDQAVATLDTARALINTVTVGGPYVIPDYVAQVERELGTARGYFETAQQYINQGLANHEEAAAYAALGAAEIEGGNASINEALGYIQKITNDLNIVDRGEAYELMGRRKVRDVIQRIKGQQKPTQHRRYARV